MTIGYGSWDEVVDGVRRRQKASQDFFNTPQQRNPMDKALKKLLDCEPGTRFAILNDDGVSCFRTGVLISVNECRARVRYDSDGRHVVIDDKESGVAREFDAPSRPLDISAGTLVQVIPAQ